MGDGNIIFGNMKKGSKKGEIIVKDRPKIKENDKGKI